MRYVGALDVGTTTVRFHIIDEQTEIVASCTAKVELLYPAPGYAEINPNKLWGAIQHVMKQALQDSKLPPESISCIGISTQRGSFTTWDPNDGRHYHNFITWKDLRADSLVKEWNSSITMKLLKKGSQFMYCVTRLKRFLASSVFRFMNTQISLRLLWALQHVPGLQEAINSGNAIFGGVDCWLLYKLTGKHVTDVSSASATGLYDPFTMSWSELMLNLLKIPQSILPEVVDTTGNFGNTPKELFGVEIPILCSMADQSASLFGLNCLKPGDLKITMGTGTFLDANTGDKPHASVAGLYPLVAWRIKDEVVYMVEGAANDTGTIIEWAKSLGLFNEPSETTDMANSVISSDGVQFVPAFSGLQAPINDYSAATGFIGLRPTTTKNHMVRSMLESIVCRMYLLYEALCEETSYTYHRIRVDGGVSENDFIIHALADLTSVNVEKAMSTEMSSFGVAFLAGLEAGIWSNRGDVFKLRRANLITVPTRCNKLVDISEWKRAVQRFTKWY